MNTLAVVLITFFVCVGIAVVIGALAAVAIARWSDEAMDEIMNHDRHNYKDTERGTGGIK